MKRARVVSAVVWAVACSPQVVVAPDAGPMPLVHALYAASLPATLEARTAYFTDDLAQALTDNAARADAIAFDYRSWAMEPEIEGPSFAIDEQATQGDRAGVVVRFTHPRIDAAMVVEYELCRRENGDWRIAEITGAPAGDAVNAGDAPASLRRMIAMPEATGEGC